MEITNYEAMLSASKTIKKIADEAVITGTKVMQETNASVTEKMAQYIFSVLEPVFDSPITYLQVQDCLMKETLSINDKANWSGKNKAQLRNNDLGILIYFSKDGYEIRVAKPESIITFVSNWSKFKERLDIAIDDAIQKYNKKREQEVDHLAYVSRVLENFEV